MRIGQTSASKDDKSPEILRADQRLRAAGMARDTIEADFAARALMIAYHKQAFLRLVRRCADALQALTGRLPQPTSAPRKPGA